MDVQKDEGNKDMDPSADENTRKQSSIKGNTEGAIEVQEEELQLHGTH